MKYRSRSELLAHDIAYRPDVDGLRAVAILVVVIFHAFPRALPGGFVGVDVFFVISGFLISSIIFSELKRGGFRFGRFYARRVMRLFPALILVLLTCMVLGWFALLPGEIEQLGKHVAAGMGFGQNVMLWTEAGYFDASADLKPLRHLWSLGVEEQYYLLYPLLVWVVWRTRIGLLNALIVIAIMSFALSVVRAGTEAFYLPHTRFWELLMGGMLAYRQVLWGAPFGWRGDRVIANALTVVGLMLIAGTSWWLTEKHPFPGWWALLPTIGACLIIGAGRDAWVNRYVLGNRAMVFVGLISYPLYLWHWPLLSFAHIVESGADSGVIRAGAVGLSLVLATATYLCLEVPLRRYKNVAVKTSGLCVMGIVVLCVGVALSISGGVPARAKAWPDVQQFEWGNRLENDTCRKAYPEFRGRFCNMLRPVAPTVMLIGDSHSMMLYDGVAHALEGTKENVVNLAAIGCMPFINAPMRGHGVPLGPNDGSRCQEDMNEVISIVQKTGSVHTVVLAHYGGLGINPHTAEEWAAMAASMRKTFDRLLSAGKRVVYVIDIPELVFMPQSCVKMRPVTLTNRIRVPCAYSSAYHRDTLRGAYENFVRGVLKEVPAVRVFDGPAALCDDVLCWAMKDGDVLYVDPNHLTVAGSKYVGKRLMEQALQ